MFYVYEHMRNDTNAIFYVGKGKEYRAKSTKNRNQYWANVVNKAGGFTVNYVVKNIDEELAYLCEQERIDQLKRIGCELTNLTIGGEGAGAGENHHMWGKPHPDKGSKRPWLRERFLGANNPQWGKPSAMRGIAKPKGILSPLYGRARPMGAGKPSKAVTATDSTGVVFNFASLTDAGNFIGADRHSIGRWCFMRKFVKEYKWEFAK